MKEEIELHKFSPGDACFARFNGKIVPVRIERTFPFGAEVSIGGGGGHNVPNNYLFRDPAEVAEHMEAQAEELRREAAEWDGRAAEYRELILDDDLAWIIKEALNGDPEWHEHWAGGWELDHADAEAIAQWIAGACSDDLAHIGGKAREWAGMERTLSGLQEIVKDLRKSQDEEARENFPGPKAKAREVIYAIH